MSLHDQRIEGDIRAKHVQIGRGAVVEKGVVICGKDGGLADTVILGDYAYIGRDVTIRVPEFRLGHYSKLHEHGFLHGRLPLQIGRNCWIGGYCTLDSEGGLDIDDNVGIGAHSQLWTHIKFGDVVEGCRWNSTKYMHVGKDAWFVGHCIVSPVSVAERSMALVGSVVTRDMEANHVYGGVPAKDLTDKVGGQFEERTVYEKGVALNKLLGEYVRKFPDYEQSYQVVVSEAQFNEFVAKYGGEGVTIFDVSRRVYNRAHTPAEVGFLKEYTPLIKFTAWDEPHFIDRQDRRAMRETLFGWDTGVARAAVER